MKTKEFKVHTVEEMGAFAREWLASASAHHVLLLEGEMGAGKTQFCQLVLESFGIKDVASPTFNLIHSYHLNTGKVIHHLDLFRLESEEELESTGFWDLLAGPALVLVEWGGRLDPSELSFAPWRVEQLKISVLPGGARQLELKKLF